MQISRLQIFFNRFLSILLFITLTGCGFLDPDKDKKILSGKRENIFKSDAVLPNHLSSSSAHYDSRNTPCNKKSDVLEGELNISHTFKSEFSSNYYPVNTVLVLNDKLFILYPSGQIAAYDKNSKEMLWKNSFFNNSSFIRGWFRSAGDRGFLAYDKDLIYIAYGAKAVIAIDSKNGNLVWNSTLNSSARGGEVLNGTLFITAADDNVYALDTRNGSLIWKYIGLSEGVSLFDERRPVIYKDMLLVQSNYSDVVAINVKNGQELWSSSMSESRALKTSDILSFSTSLIPILDGNILFFTTSDGAINAINLDKRVLVWSKVLAIRKQLWLCGNHIYALGDANQLMSISKHNGSVAWTVDLSKYLDSKNKSFAWTSPILIDNKILVISSSGTMLVFDASNGDYLGAHKVLDKIYSQPLSDEKYLYLISNRGRILQYAK